MTGIPILGQTPLELRQSSLVKRNGVISNLLASSSLITSALPVEKDEVHGNRTSLEELEHHGSWWRQYRNLQSSKRGSRLTHQTAVQRDTHRNRKKWKSEAFFPLGFLD